MQDQMRLFMKNAQYDQPIEKPLIKKEFITRDQVLGQNSNEDNHWNIRSNILEDFKDSNYVFTSPDKNLKASEVKIITESKS